MTQRDGDGVNNPHPSPQNVDDKRILSSTFCAVKLVGGNMNILGDTMTNKNDDIQYLAITMHGQCVTCGTHSDNMECDKWVTNDDYTVFQCPRCARENERTCDVCGETGDATCFTGTGICATENAVDDNATQ